jgi:hypothetical protein
MKRFVLSDAGSAYTLGAIGGVIVGLTDGSAGVAYLLAFAFGIVGMVLLFGPESVQRWREQDPKS